MAPDVWVVGPVLWMIRPSPILSRTVFPVTAYRSHMALERIPKATFKAHALEVLRRIEATRASVVSTDRGRPVARLVPFHGDDAAVRDSLRGTVCAYREPTEPVDDAGWCSVRHRGQPAARSIARDRR